MQPLVNATTGKEEKGGAKEVYMISGNYSLPCEVQVTFICILCFSEKKDSLSEIYMKIWRSLFVNGFFNFNYKLSEKWEENTYQYQIFIKLSYIDFTVKNKQHTKLFQKKSILEMTR